MRKNQNKIITIEASRAAQLLPKSKVRKGITLLSISPSQNNTKKFFNNQSARDNNFSPKPEAEAKGPMNSQWQKTYFKQAMHISQLRKSPSSLRSPMNVSHYPETVTISPLQKQDEISTQFNNSLGQFKLFEPGSYGIKVNGVQAILNGKSNNQSSLTSSLINGSPHDRDRVLESPRFPIPETNEEKQMTQITEPPEPPGVKSVPALGTMSAQNSVEDKASISVIQTNTQNNTHSRQFLLQGNQSILQLSTHQMEDATNDKIMINQQPNAQRMKIQIQQRTSNRQSEYNSSPPHSPTLSPKQRSPENEEEPAIDTDQYLDELRPFNDDLTNSKGFENNFSRSVMLLTHEKDDTETTGFHISPVDEKEELLNVYITQEKGFNNQMLFDCVQELEWVMMGHSSVKKMKYGEDVIWVSQPLKIQAFNSIKPHQIVNQFPKMHHIMKIDKLVFQLQRMKNMFPRDYKIYPKTWLLPQDLGLIQQHLDLTSDVQSNYSSGLLQSPHVLIVKTISNSKHQETLLTMNFEELQSLMSIAAPTPTPNGLPDNPIDTPMPRSQYVVQSYIKCPYLIDNKKFDFKLYVLITDCNPLTIFLHKQGLYREADKAFDLQDFEDLSKHIPSLNNCKPLQELWIKLRRHGINTKDLQTKIKDIIIKTMLSVHADILHHYKVSGGGNRFQILEFTMMIDDFLKPWLIKVQSQPDFTFLDFPSVDQNIKYNVMKDTLKMLGLDEHEKAKRVKENVKKITMNKKKIQSILKIKGDYEWIFPIDSRIQTEETDFEHIEHEENIRGTHYIHSGPEESNHNQSDGFNFKAIGQTSLGQTNTMANLNDKQVYGSSSNLMQTIPQFTKNTEGQKSQGFRTLKLNEQGVPQTITQVTINTKGIGVDKNMQDSNDVSSVDQNEHHDQNPNPLDQPRIQIQTNNQADPKKNMFKTLREAENYYKIFQKTMQNISKKKKTKLMSPAQIMEKNFMETIRNTGQREGKYQMYLDANRTLNFSPRSHPKFEQVFQKKVMMNQQMQQSKQASNSNASTSKFFDNKLLDNNILMAPEIIDSNEQMEQHEIFKSMFSNHQFKRQLYHENIKRLAEDAHRQFASPQIKKQTLQQHLMQLNQSQKAPVVSVNIGQKLVQSNDIKSKTLMSKTNNQTQSNAWLKRMGYHVNRKKMSHQESLFKPFTQMSSNQLIDTLPMQFTGYPTQHMRITERPTPPKKDQIVGVAGITNYTPENYNIATREYLNISNNEMKIVNDQNNIDTQENSNRSAEADQNYGIQMLQHKLNNDVTHLIRENSHSQDNKSTNFIQTDMGKNILSIAENSPATSLNNKTKMQVVSSHQMHRQATREIDSSADSLQLNKEIDSPHAKSMTKSMKKAESPANMGLKLPKIGSPELRPDADFKMKLIEQDKNSNNDLSESLKNQLINEALQQSPSAVFENNIATGIYSEVTRNQNPHAFAQAKTSRRTRDNTWYKHKYGYDKSQNRIEEADINKESEGQFDFMKEHLSQMLKSPTHIRASKAHLEELQKQRLSGASGNLQSSPSVGLIKFQARSNSTITAGVKSLKLPQLTRRNYVPSSNRDEFENSKIVSHQELRQLNKFNNGAISPHDLSAHMRNMIGIRRQSAEEIQLERILNLYTQKQVENFENALQNVSTKMFMTNPHMSLKINQRTILNL